MTTKELIEKVEDISWLLPKNALDVLNNAIEDIDVWEDGEVTIEEFWNLIEDHLNYYENRKSIKLAIKNCLEL